jgi:hypothetical protein
MEMANIIAIRRVTIEMTSSATDNDLDLELGTH